MAPDDIARQRERLSTHRERLLDLLQQQASLGSHAPPHIPGDIREARRQIGRIKSLLHDAGCPVEDHPDDGEVAAPAAARNDLSPGVELFHENPRFRAFHRTRRLSSLIDTIVTTPCYHIIEAPMGHGKTALVGELWRTLAGSPSICLAYLFSRDHGRTRVSQAVRSLYRQLRESGYLKLPLPEEDTALTANVLNSVARHGAQLYIILDGIDECDDAERSQLSLLFPDGLVPNVTIVVTIRPLVRQLLLHYLPHSHMLQGLEVATARQGTVLHRLYPFTREEIHALVPTPDGSNLARRIFEHSQGLPMVAVPYLEQPRLLDDIEAGAIPIDAYYERVLRLMVEQCPEGQHDLLQSLLALLAAARSPLSPGDVATLLSVPRPVVASMRGLLARFQQLDSSGGLTLDRHFRDYLARADATFAAVAEAGARLSAWATSFIEAASLGDVPSYALRHAAEYLATMPSLRRLLARPDWFSELEQRSHARSTCIDALKRAQDIIDQSFTGFPGDPAVVNMILCALARASLSATLLPELVAQLVQLGLWGEAAARDYAENYASQANRQTLLTLLASPEKPLIFPVGSAAAEAAMILRHYRALPSAAQQVALAAWRHTYEQAGSNAAGHSDRDRIVLVLEALRQPPLSGGSRASLGEFGQLLGQIQAYVPPPTGPMSDPAFADLLASLADTWWQLHPRESSRVWLQPIMATLTRFARADILEALELLAPTLRTLFPEPMDDLCAALEEMAQTLP